MKVNLAWLSRLIDINGVDKEELLKCIGSQLGEIEAVVDIGRKYKGALLVKVDRVVPHPNADNLCICAIDDGQKVLNAERLKDGLVQVVCSAPNVRAGMTAVWLPPASFVPVDCGTEREVSLEAREIRGVVSYGMLASAHELDIGADDKGILEVSLSDYPSELDGQPQPGSNFAAQFDLDTTVIDIENKMFTHRPDCFGLLGVSREIAAIAGVSFSEKPDWYRLHEEVLSPACADFSIDVQCPQLVPRLRAAIIKGLQPTKASSLLMRARLSSVGIKPVNNIVDITNYVMYLSGQPTHAFDYDKLLKLSSDPTKPLTLVARQSREGEQLKLLNGKTLTFDQPAIVIATDSHPVALGGIMGGAETEVDVETQHILVECANFDIYHLRRTTMHYGIFSEAATRFTKGQSPAQIPSVTAHVADLIIDSAGVAEGIAVCEFATEEARFKPSFVETTPDFINQLLGSRLSAMEITSLLEAVEFGVSLNEESLKISPPFWRTDIAIAEDIVEEIGRLAPGGYSSLKPTLPLKAIASAEVDGLLALRAKIRRRLAAAGACETMGYSFVADDLLRTAGQDPDNSFRLLNPLNSDLQAYRQSLTPSVLSQAEDNRRLGYKDFALFEIGCAHRKQPSAVDDEGLPVDLQRIALICRRSAAADSFYSAKSCLDLIASSLGLSFDYRPCQPAGTADIPMFQPYNPDRSALISVNGRVFGIIGLLKAGAGYAGWEFDTERLLTAADLAERTVAYKELARHPKSSQDLTLQVKTATVFADLEKSLQTVLETCRDQGLRTDLRALGIFQPPNVKVKNISFRLTVWHKERTLKRGEVSAVIAGLVKAAKTGCNASQVV